MKTVRAKESWPDAQDATEVRATPAHGRCRRSRSKVALCGLQTFYGVVSGLASHLRAKFTNLILGQRVARTTSTSIRDIPLWPQPSNLTSLSSDPRRLCLVVEERIWGCHTRKERSAARRRVASRHEAQQALKARTGSRDLSLCLLQPQPPQTASLVHLGLSAHFKAELRRCWWP